MNRLRVTVPDVLLSDVCAAIEQAVTPVGYRTFFLSCDDGLELRVVPQPTARDALSDVEVAS